MMTHYCGNAKRPAVNNKALWEVQLSHTVSAMAGADPLQM